MMRTKMLQTIKQIDKLGKIDTDWFDKLNHPNKILVLMIHAK